MFKKIVLSLILCYGFSCSNTYGQFAIGLGIEGGGSFSLNKQGYYNKLNMGLSATASYHLANSALYPSFTFTVNTMQLPVYNDYYNDWNVITTTRRYMLNLNYDIESRIKGISLLGGLGITQVIPDGNIYINSQSSNSVQLVDKSSINLYPTIDIGAKYLYKISANHPIYLGIEANLTYIYMHNSRNDYYLQPNNGLAVPANVGGNVVDPHAVVSIYYVFERNSN